MHMRFMELCCCTPVLAGSWLTCMYRFLNNSFACIQINGITSQVTDAQRCCVLIPTDCMPYVFNLEYSIRSGSNIHIQCNLATCSHNYMEQILLEVITLYDGITAFV